MIHMFRDLFSRRNETRVRCHMKAYAMFLEYVCGFTFQTETVATRSYRSYSKSGTQGAFNGTDWTFSDASNPFDVSDVDGYGGVYSYIVIKDNSSASNALRNSGVYKVRRYISAGQIEIDYQADLSSEFPFASSNLSWWIFKSGSEPNTNGHYITLQSPHATGWAVKITDFEGYAGPGYTPSFSADGNWGGIKVQNGPKISISNGNLGTDYIFHMWAADDGSYIYAGVRESNSEGGVNDQTTTTNGFAVTEIDPVESGHSAEELIAFMAGNYGSANSFVNFDADSEGIGQAYIWSDIGQRFVNAYPCDLSYSGDGVSFKNWWLREVNWRIGGKLQVQDGLMLVMDYQNSQDHYAYYGRYKHWKFINRLQASDAADTTGYHINIPVNYGGTRNYFLLRDGWLLPWPNITPFDG